MQLKPKQKLHQQAPKELKKKLDKTQRELVDLKLKISAQKEKNVHAAKKKRHEIAIIKTILREKEQQESKSQAESTTTKRLS